MNAAKIFAAPEQNALFRFLHFHHKNIFENHAMSPTTRFPPSRMDQAKADLRLVAWGRLQCCMT
ncbi:MAG: hypothetical protein IT427_06240 [Pirellulales bacterium]|nr:hypothetical protein [Pirellulales bacterium]